MRLFKVAIPLLLLTSACKKDGEEIPDVCPVEEVDVPVTVVDTSSEPITEGVSVVISQTNPENPDGNDPSLPRVVQYPCDGSGSEWTCTAVQGDLNQITATAFPTYQPTAGVPIIEFADCESVTLELRMQANAN